MQVRTTADGATGTARLELVGELDLDTVGMVRDEILALLTRSRPGTICLDMSQVSMVDSTAVGTLVGCHRAAEAAGARLELARPSAFVRRVLWVSGLQGLFGLPAVPPGEARTR